MILLLAFVWDVLCKGCRFSLLASKSLLEFCVDKFAETDKPKQQSLQGVYGRYYQKQGKVDFHFAFFGICDILGMHIISHR